MSFQNCVVCGKTLEQAQRLLPHFRSEKDYKYIHKKCLLLFNSDWNNRIAVNEKLYYKDYLRHCSICGQKSHVQVVRCAQRYLHKMSHSSCSKRFHLDCVINPVFQANSDGKQHHSRLLIYCGEHGATQIGITNLDEVVNAIFSEHLQYQEPEPGQIKKSKHKKKYKRKHSRSRSHRKSRKSSINYRFSDSGGSKESQLKFKKPNSKQKQDLLQLPTSLITHDMVQEVMEIKRQASIAIKEPENFQEQLQNQQVLFQPLQKAFDKQIIYPLISRPFIEDPEFPWTERENRRDQSILKWWDKIEEIYFKGDEKLVNTKIEDFSNPFEWYDQGLDNELLDYADQINFEPIVQLRYLYRGSLNVIFKCSQSSQYFTEHVNRSTPKGLMQTNVRLYKFPLENIDITTFSEKEINGRGLTYQEECELTQEEYDKCLQLEQQMNEQQQLLESQLDIDSGTIQKLDIAYQIMKNDLNCIVEENNKMRQAINAQQVDYNIGFLTTEQQLLMDLLKWSQIVKAFINGYKDKDKDVLNSFYPCSIQTTSQSSQKAQLKKKKIHSKENTQPLDTDCKICFDYHYTDFNPVIYCGKCQTSFHKNCYGLSGPLDEDDVLCDACQYETQKLNQYRRGAAKCRICKKLGLPQRYIKTSFYHVSCLLLTNQVILQDGTYDVRNRKNDIKQYCKDNESSTPQCSVCGDTKGYRFMCCGNETIPCRHAFHPICAYLNGLTINIESENLEQCCKELKFAQLAVRIKCVLHCGKNLQELLLQTYYRRFALNYEQTAKCGGEEIFMEEFKKTKGYRQFIKQTLKIPVPEVAHFKE